jgi:hypothetical protein
MVDSLLPPMDATVEQQGDSSFTRRLARACRRLRAPGYRHRGITGLAEESRSPLGPFDIPAVYRRRYFQHDPDRLRAARGGKAPGQNEFRKQHLCQFSFRQPLPQGISQPSHMYRPHLPQETTEVGRGMGTVALFQEPAPHLAHLYLQPLLSISQPPLLIGNAPFLLSQRSAGPRSR